MLKFREKTNSWPGFVDLFSNLVIILIFLLIVFVVLWTTTNIFGRASDSKKIIALKNESAAQIEMITQLTMEEEEAKNLLVMARNELEALMMQIAQISDEKRELEDKLQANTMRAAELDSQVQEKSETIQELIAAYETKLYDLQSKSSDMTMLIRDLEDQLRTANRKNEMNSEEVGIRRASLEREIARLNAALEASEEKNMNNEVKFIELSERLNRALADKVAQMAEYQSQFYKAIKMALADDRFVDTSTDRFVIPSDILFSTGSFALSPEGKKQLRMIANIVIELEGRIPEDTNWIIRVDGHTDSMPVRKGSRQFGSNMELSLLRAKAVVDELVHAGVKARRLVPSGFGANFPVSSEKTPAAMQKSRRIELRLTNP
jgi:chemotaxis protein MotB